MGLDYLPLKNIIDTFLENAIDTKQTNAMITSQLLQTARYVATDKPSNE